MILTAALGAVVVAALVVTNWSTVRDHVEAWHFQLTRETETQEPSDVDYESISVEADGTIHSFAIAYPSLYGMLARYSERPVIFEVYEGIGDDMAVRIGRGQTLPGADVLQVLKDNGCRVLGQRFPRRAYVVIRDADPRSDRWTSYPTNLSAADEQ